MLDYQIGQGYSALDAQAWRSKLEGYGVVSGLAVSAGSGLSVDVASGTAIVGVDSGDIQSVTLASTANVELDAADADNPRKDTIYIDGQGNVDAETGTAKAANPEGNERFNTFSPEPPIPNDVTVLAEVWVDAEATTIGSADIRDRRAPADGIFEDLSSSSVATDSLDGGIAGDGNTITAQWGDAGEYRMVGIIPYVAGGSVTLNTSSFIELGGTTERVTLPRNNVGTATNLDGTLYASLTAYISNPGDQVTLRLPEIPASEVSAPVTTTVQSSIVEYSDEFARIQGKIESGTADIERMAVIVYERVND